MIGEIAAALTAARATLELTRAALDVRDDIKAKSLLADLQNKLVDATSAALALSEKNVALHTALRESEDAKREIERKVEDRVRYALHELRTGAFAYVYRPAGDGDSTPLHYICQPCYDGGAKTVLQFVPGNPGFVGSWRCAASKEHTIYDKPQSMK